MRVNPLNKAFDEHGQPSPGVEKFLNHALRVQPVSYTHLTLPTILRV